MHTFCTYVHTHTQNRRDKFNSNSPCLQVRRLNCLHPHWFWTLPHWALTGLYQRATPLSHGGIQGLRCQEQTAFSFPRHFPAVYHFQHIYTTRDKTLKWWGYGKSLQTQSMFYWNPNVDACLPNTPESADTMCKFLLAISTVQLISYIYRYIIL